MKRLFFLFLFAFAAFAFIGCSEDDDSGITPTSVEPPHIYTPIEYYAPLTDSQRTSYGADLITKGFELEDGEYYKSTSSMILAVSIAQYSGGYYLILMAARGGSSVWPLPIAEFPTIPLGVERVAEGYYKLYEGNAAGYFLYLKNQHKDNGDERYVIDGDETFFCADLGTTLSCSSYDVDDGDYSSFTLDMDKAFFQALTE